ncbi:MAG: nitroreductase family protein [Candidatus Latescibacterota bacterium]
MTRIHNAIIGILAVSTAVITFAGPSPAQIDRSKIPDALTVIHNRKSVRKYLNKPVSKEQLEVLLRAGMASPTAGDRRPWAFVVITERAMLDTLYHASPYTKMLRSAQAAIVVCGDQQKSKSEVWIHDCSAASENILLAAEAIGLGAVWCGIFLNPEPTAYVKKALGLPEQVYPLNIISIGYPTGEEKPKDKWDPKNIHWNKW